MIEGATVLIVDGEISAVGSDLDVPAGATVLDASGMWITPGLINASTDIGLVEIGYTSAEVSYDDDDVSAAFDVRPSINPQSGSDSRSSTRWGDHGLLIAGRWNCIGPGSHPGFAW